MFKKYKLVVALCVVGIFSGFTTQTADASASVGGDNQEKQTNQTQTQTPKQEQESVYFNSYEEMQEYIKNYFSKWNSKEDKTSNQEENQAKPEVNKPEAQPEAQPEAENQTSKEETKQDTQSSELNAFEEEVVELTNQEREKNGLSTLKADKELSKVARDKSKDMQKNNYFSHNSPTYGSPFDMMQSYGVDYRSAGENIARGQRTPKEVVNGWMNSEGHRANILNDSFTHIGVGYEENGNYWTQQFIGK